MEKFKRWRTVFLLLIVIIISQKSCHGQSLKVKDDKTCTTKMASKYRVHSLLIGRSISQTFSNIESFVECQRRCSVDTVCQYGAHNEATKACLFFKENLARETISRLLFEGWKYGRVNSDGKVLAYTKASTCDKKYCEESCLDPVEEKCSSTVYTYPNCDTPTGTFRSCKEARELVAANPSLDISSPSGYNSVLNELVLIDLNIEGIEFSQYCGPDDEFSTISTTSGDFLKLYWSEIHYTSTVHEPRCIFKYNKKTYDLHQLKYDRTYLYKLGLYQWEYKIDWGSYYSYDILNSHGTGGIMITPYGTLQLITGGDRNCFLRTYLHYRHRFEKKNDVCYRRSDVYDQFRFTSIVGAVTFSHYEIDTSTISDFVQHNDFPSNPFLTGTLINFDSAQHVKDNFCVRMQALFVPPTTGAYIFGGLMDDFGKVYLSRDETEANKQEIINVQVPRTRILSESKNLEAGKRYYLELIGCERGGGDYFTVNVRLPDGSLVDPITYNYLEPITSP